MSLAGPVAASDPFIHLDSFLAYAAGVEAIGFDELQQLSGSPEYFEDEMPLEKTEVGDDWVWSCSAAHAGYMDEPGMGEWFVARWRKRFDNDPEHAKKNTQVNITTGEFKSYNAALPYSPATELVFYFEGDAEAVQNLIDRHVAGIGKKNTQGYGLIRDIEITETGRSSAVYHDGHVLRSVPARFLNGAETGVTIERRTTRPPYWHADNQCMAVAPFEEIPEDKLADAVVDG